MEKIDYKKTNKELYSPKTKPSVIQVPKMNFIMVDGQGNPNEENGAYHHAVEVLYSLSYTIKMTNKKMISESDNLFDYVVPPLEGLWWLSDDTDMDFSQKEKYNWTSMIRQPEFVTAEMFQQAMKQVKKKNPQIDVTKARLSTLEEGLCVQCMHIGPFATEAITIEKIEAFIKANELQNDFTTLNGVTRRHHEIYLSDPRKSDPSTMKTVLRHPVKKLG